MLPSYASNSIFLVSRKDIIHNGFLELSGQVSGIVAVAKTPLLNFVFWRERRLPLTQAGSFTDVAVVPETSGCLISLFITEDFETLVVIH